MAMKVSRLLELIKEQRARDEDYIYSLIGSPPGFIQTDTNCACFGLKEVEVMPNQVIPSLTSKIENPKPIKIVVVVEVIRDLDYYTCLTVGDFKRFLENIDDQDEKVYIATPSGLAIGQYIPVINASMKEIVGENIFYLWI